MEFLALKGGLRRCEKCRVYPVSENLSRHLRSSTERVCDGSDELWRDFVKKFEPCSLILRMRQWQSISHEIQIAHKVEVKGRDH